MNKPARSLNLLRHMHLLHMSTQTNTWKATMLSNMNKLPTR